MTGYAFQKASKRRARARVALIGPSGSGKTYTALAIASAMGGRVAVIDTEHGSASKYADVFEFAVLELTTFSPLTYVEAMKAAAEYDVLVIDSLSHAWMGKDGALEQVDRAAKRTPSGNSFAAWRDVTPMHNALVEALVAHPAHLIVTMRSKTEYVLDKDERTGKTMPRKVGTAPVQRDGLEYEFDVVADLNLDHDLIVSKTRCPALDGVVVNKAGADIAGTLLAWLSDGAPAPASVSVPSTNGVIAGAPPEDRPSDPAPDPEPVDEEDNHVRPLCEAAIRDRDVAALAPIRDRIARLPDGFHKTGSRRWLALATVLLDSDGLTASAKRAARALIDGMPDDTPGKSQAIDILTGAEAA